MDRKIGVDHSNAGPYTQHELPPGDQLAVPLYEGDKNIEGPAAERNGLIRFEQKALLWKQTEGVEPDGGHA